MGTRSTMRLFHGHYKMAEGSVKKIFLMQLNYIYSIKLYMVGNLTVLADSASFSDLKYAIHESIDEIKMQLLRMDKIYMLIGEAYVPDACVGLKTLTTETYAASKSAGMTAIETDFSFLVHLRAIESMEIVYYTVLLDLSAALPGRQLDLLLKQNVDMSKETSQLYELLSKEYIY